MPLLVPNPGYAFHVKWYMKGSSIMMTVNTYAKICTQYLHAFRGGKNDMKGTNVQFICYPCVRNKLVKITNKKSLSITELYRIA